MIKKRRILFCALTGIVILAISLYAYIMMPRGKLVVLLESDELFEILRDGDIICRLGDRFWSNVFRDMSIEDRRYSHVGIVRVDSVSGAVTVIHSEGDTGHGRDFVNEVTLPEFLSVARAIGVYRANDAAASAGLNASDISAAALEYIGIPFDWRFDMRDTTKLYCTELLYVILKRIAPNINLQTVYSRELSREIIPLEAISNSEFFSEAYFVGSRK